MKFVILDVYPHENHRLIKDTAGGYGTGNNFGKNLFSKLLNFYVDSKIGMPAMEIMYISSILKKDHEIHYTRKFDDPKIIDADFIIFPSSIIAHETEINTLEKLRDCLQNLGPEITIKNELILKAKKPLITMLNLS